MTIDSAASRLPRLADDAAYARKWADEGAGDARALGGQFGIQLP